MKGLNKTAALVLAALVMTACNKEDGAVNNEDVAVRFSAQVGEQTDEISAQTRASNEDWVAGDRMGVYAFLNGTTTVVLDMENKEYMADEAGTSPDFSPADGNDIFFPVNGPQKFDFMAYYPYQDVTDFNYIVDVSDQSKPEEIDLLYANTIDTEPGGYDKTNPDVAFVFYHKLTKITLQTVPGPGLTAADLVGMIITIKGMNTQTNFNLETGELGNASSSVDLTPFTLRDGEMYQSIVLPAEGLYGEWSVEFFVKGDTYKWEIPAIILEEGKEYIWKISVQKKPVLISGRIVNWDWISHQGDAW